MRIPPTILVVDDNAANVEILETRLVANGYHVLTAHDGEQALAAARSSLPDLILLDIMMPKIDGLTVYRELKADPSLPFMPIILITAKTASRDIVEGLDRANATPHSLTGTARPLHLAVHASAAGSRDRTT